MARLNIIVAIIGILFMWTYAQEELYSDKYDDVDVMAILNNERLRMEYYKCFMDLAPCITGDAKFFREIFGEALQTKCKKCTEKQKKILEQIIEWYTKNKPDEWQAIIAKSIEDIKKKNAQQ